MKVNNEAFSNVKLDVHGSVPSSAVKISSQQLTETIEAASADAILEPPDSGDFHEAFTVPDGSGDVAVFMGDVTGHGADAAVKANVIRREAVAHLKAGETPLETIQAANEASQSDGDRFSTLFVARIDGRTGHIAYANAGHDTPFITNERGHVHDFETTGPPLGVVPNSEGLYDEKEAKLPKGSTLLVTTDGVTEARQPAQMGLHFFGADRLRFLIRNVCRASAIKIVQEVISKVLRFTRQHIYDDIAVVAIKRNHTHPDASRQQSTVDSYMEKPAP